MGLFASQGWDNVQAEYNTGDGLAQVNECPGKDEDRSVLHCIINSWVQCRGDA